MFKDESFDTVNVISDLKEDKYVRDQLTQTREISYEDKYCQSVLKINVDVQTEFESVLPQSTRIKIDNSKKLSEFMLRTYPLISEQLLANVRSRAFDGYEVDWEETEENEEIECLNKFRDESLQSELSVTCVDWNCTGSVVAAAFGSLNHEAWCVHHAVIHTWNIDRNNINESKPDKVIDTDCCILSIAFNPKQPAILAGGDFSGKILIWDMSKEENMLVAYTGKDIMSHQEAVTNISWGNQKGTRSFELISVGSDGKILFWEFNQLKMKLTSTKKFLLSNESIPRAYRNGFSKNDLVVGISCFAYSPKNGNKIYLGTEGGGVFKCYVEGSRSLSKVINNEKYSIPLVQGYKGHSAIVNCISIAKHVNNIFATCSADMMLYVYSSENVNPIIEVEPAMGSLLNLQWSPERPTILAVSTLSGSVLIYDFTENMTAPMNVIPVGKSAVHTLSFNKDRPILLASGNNENFLCTWQLTNSYGLMKVGEESFFTSLLED